MKYRLLINYSPFMDIFITSKLNHLVLVMTKLLQKPWVMTELPEFQHFKGLIILAGWLSGMRMLIMFTPIQFTGKKPSVCLHHDHSSISGITYKKQIFILLSDLLEIPQSPQLISLNQYSTSRSFRITTSVMLS